MDHELITTAQAADLLGVRVATIYSYVSRGLLRPVDTGRSRHEGSRFSRAEVVDMVTARRRPRRGHFELTIETAVTSMEPSGVLLYRGRDVAELSMTHRFEAVAEIVWGAPTEVVWPDLAPVIPASTRHGDLVLHTIGQAAATDDERDSLSPSHFRNAGRRTISLAATTLAASRGGSTRGRVAERILAGVAATTPVADAAHAFDVALGLLADHELATSTLAARAAASTGADPYAVMTTGVAALGGVRHGTASTAAYDVLCDALAGAPAPRGAVPGFGHAVYTDVDPRAAVLLDIVADLDDEVAAATNRLSLHVRRETGLAPNVDLGLAALVLACGARRDAGEAVFAIARLAGFIAHGIEEQGHPLRFRARATYTGASRGSTAGPT